VRVGNRLVEPCPAIPEITQRMDAPQVAEDPLPSRHKAEGEDLRDRGEWKWVLAGGGRRIPSCPPSPPQVLLHNRYEALEPEGQANDRVDEGPRTRLPRARQSAPRITTASTKTKRRVIVIGDSLLRRTEGPICRLDPAHREFCCLPGAWVRDITRKLPGLVRPTDYYYSSFLRLAVTRLGTNAHR